MEVDAWSVEDRPPPYSEIDQHPGATEHQGPRPLEPPENVEFVPVAVAVRRPPYSEIDQHPGAMGTGVAESIDLAESRPLETPSLRSRRAKLMATAALFITLGAVAGAVVAAVVVSSGDNNSGPPVYTVEMAVRLPLASDAFDAGKQALFKEAVAASAGTSESRVTIVSVSDTAVLRRSAMSIAVAFRAEGARAPTLSLEALNGALDSFLEIQATEIGSESQATEIGPGLNHKP